MNSSINAPAWANVEAHPPGSPPAVLAQLVNIAGTLCGGMAVALGIVQSSEMAEQDGLKPVLSVRERGQIIGLCLVASQVIAEAAFDASDALVSFESVG